MPHLKYFPPMGASSAVTRLRMLRMHGAIVSGRPWMVQTLHSKRNIPLVILTHMEHRYTRHVDDMQRVSV